KRVEAGDLSVAVSVDSRDETADLANGFNTMAKNLSELRTTDLQMAAKVQRNLLPQLPNAGRFDVAVHYEAFSYVSGDFYDFYTDDNGTLTGLVLFDVSGHGVSSGLITTLIRPIMYRSFTSDTKVALSDIIAKANRSIIKAKGDVDNYLTCIMLRFSGNEMQYVNAGHPDLLKKDANEHVAPVKPGGNAVQGAFMGQEGMVEFFEEMNREYQVPMTNGDVFLLFTDCLIETRSPAGEEFGLNGVSRVLRDAPSAMSAADIVKRIVAAHAEHRGGAALADDLTIVGVKVR
ncbi:MAG: SpoIIE family protein phosphatase, partial [Spirochaetota bacterium]